MPVKLEHRAKCKTQPLLEYQAKQMMMRHVADGHGGGGVAADRVVDVEVLPEAVQRQVLPRGCSVDQFQSFKLDWDWYAEKYRSQLREEHGKEDVFRLNYLVNYELLVSIPAPLEAAIYRARSYTVNTQHYRSARKIGPKSEFGPFGQNGPNFLHWSKKPKNS